MDISKIDVKDVVLMLAGVAVLATGAYLLYEKKGKGVNVVDVKDRPKTVIVSK